MALRGKQPEEGKVRVKALITGEAGSGKTTGILQVFPKTYLIDTERGAAHYRDLINKQNSVTFETLDFDDLITECRSLLSEQHEYSTMAIDSFTPIHNSALEEAEKRVGEAFGKHYGEVRKRWSRLFNLITLLDMNVMVTAHEKREMRDDTDSVIKTFDGVRGLDHAFDVWLQLERNPDTGERTAFVRKTRLAHFKDRERFPWTFDEFRNRVGDEVLTGKADTVALATPQQVERFDWLLNQLSEEEFKNLKIKKALKGVDNIADLPTERIAKGIEVIEQYRNQQHAVAA